MANKDYYSGFSDPNASDKPLPSAPAESIYSERPRLGHANSQRRPISPLNPYDTDPFTSHSTLTSQQQQYATPSLYRNGANSYSSHDNIPLESQLPKSKIEHSQYPSSGHALERQDSDSFLIQEEARDRRPRSSQKRSGFDWSRIPWVCYTVTVIQLFVFIGELVKMSSLTGSPITKPSQNPMIGPSNNLLINMGARYVACMRNEKGIQDVPATAFFCPNSTSITPDQQLCTLRDLCGFQSTNGVPNPDPNRSGDAALNTEPAPNQWFRFIIPIFLHGGFIHIASNLLLQLMIARDMEKVIGSIRFALVYFSAGIFGFVFGGNYAASGIAST